MLSRRYCNFVRPVFSKESNQISSTLSGEEAKTLYLEEIKETRTSLRRNCVDSNTGRNKNGNLQKVNNVTDKELFLCVQNNEIVALKGILDSYPDKINTIDDYGWSLLMIACQANSIETAKELLERGIDTSIRDKAGNSACSLVIKNKNLILADILLRMKTNQKLESEKNKHILVKSKESFLCKVCNNKVFSDKEVHLSSTLHNISASKGKKIPTRYVIPESNKGYQIMLKVGWDKESGLGPDGTGKKYPIKTVQKKDRKGLGHEKRKINETEQDTVKHKNRKILTREYQNNKNLEINFRREFYYNCVLFKPNSAM